MKKLMLLLLVSSSVLGQNVENKSFVSFANEFIPELDERVLTREEMWKETGDKEYFPINDIISEKTVFIPRTGANKAFYQSLNYYNRSLFMTLRKAAERARDEKKTIFVNIVAGANTPAHAFKGRNNVYKASEYTEGQWTILGIDPRGELLQDHYRHGQYGQLGRDGVSYQHAIKVFKATDLRKAVERAEKSDKEHDWQVSIKMPDEQEKFYEFDTFAQYEEFFNRNRLYERKKEQYKVVKTKTKKPLAKNDTKQ